MNVDALDDFLIEQGRIRVVINLFGGDNVNFLPSSGQVERQIGEDLASRGMIREKIPINKNNASHWRVSAFH
jgi:hypothetical protein